MGYVLPRQLNSLAKLRGYFFLSLLGEGMWGGRLILGYQKSLPAPHTLTQTANSFGGVQKFSALES